MKNHKVALWGGTAIGFVATGLTMSWAFLGAILGYWLGFVNTLWLYRDTVSGMELDTLTALQKMRRSFFARLGLMVLVVALIGRFHAEWLLFLALGIAAGLIVSLELMIGHLLKQGKG